MDKKEFRRKSISRLIMIIVLVFLINYIGSIRFFRIDLTSENRFTLNKISRTILSDLQDVVYIRIFLSGDLPSDLVRFNQSIKEILIDFRAYAGKNLEFEFVNLYSEPDPKLRNEMISGLAKKGLKVTETRSRTSREDLPQN